MSRNRSYFGDWHKVVEYFRKDDKKANMKLRSSYGRTDFKARKDSGKDD